MKPERTIGETLRQAREERGLSQEDVSRATRISLAVIRKLELDRFSEMPGTLYTENFIRILADHLQLDRGELLARLREGRQNEAVADQPELAVEKPRLRRQRQKEESVSHVWHEETIQETRVRGWQPRWRVWLTLASVAGLALLVLLFGFGYIHLEWGRQGFAPEGTGLANEGGEATLPPPDARLIRANPGLSPLEQGQVPGDATQDPVPLEGSARGEAAANPPVKPPLAPLREEGGPAAVPVAQAPLRLAIETAAACRIQLNVDDQRHLTRSFPEEGGSWLLEAQSFFIFSASAAEGLRLRLNDEDYPLPAGESERILALRLDASSLSAGP